MVKRKGQESDDKNKTNIYCVILVYPALPLVNQGDFYTGSPERK